MVHAPNRSYVGERGWELYVPSESAVAVYDALKEAAATLGLDTPEYVTTVGLVLCWLHV